MTSLKSQIITGAKPDPETIAMVQDKMGIDKDVSMEFMVFSVQCDGKTVYCCWSTGKIEDNETYFSLIGKASLEALINLPLGSRAPLVIRELKLCSQPLESSILNTIRAVEPGSKICFLGDMTGELDGYMFDAFNVQDETLSILH
jgi:hypothetical protein